MHGIVEHSPSIRDENRRSSRSDMRFFFHMPKTAGGTLVHGIIGNPGVRWPLDPDYPAPGTLAPAAGQQVWLGGHTAFGLHLLYDAEPFYITVLRDPVERLISEFFYHHAQQDPGLFIPDGERIGAFVRHVQTAAHLNAYSYHFSDFSFSLESVESGAGPWNGCPATAFALLRRRRERLGFIAEHVAFERVDPSECYDGAVANIERFIRFVGFFDRLSDVAGYLAHEHGLKVSLGTRVHQTPWMPCLEDLPGDVQTMLARKTEADRELYSGLSRKRSTAVA